MTTKFRIGVNTAEEILSHPPPQFRHLNLIFTPFGIDIGKHAYPMPGWTDFAGVFLFRWWRAVWRLAEGKSRCARLPFWYTYEMWLRRTAGPWWRLSLVERKPESKHVSHEALVVPEVVESELLTATQKLLAGARRVGVWTEDCAALEAVLKDRESYFEGLEAGTIRPPGFLSGTVSIPRPAGAAWQLLLKSPEPGGAGTSRPVQSRRNLPPVLCPRCSAVLQPWHEGMPHQTCPLCGQRVPR